MKIIATHEPLMLVIENEQVDKIKDLESLGVYMCALSYLHSNNSHDFTAFIREISVQHDVSIESVENHLKYLNEIGVLEISLSKN